MSVIQFGKSKKAEPVYLNVYDLFQANYSASAGMGLYHSGIVCFDKEYTFAGPPPELAMQYKESGSTGVMCHAPQQVESPAVFKERLYLGDTLLSYFEFQAFIQNKISPLFPCIMYHPLHYNCNHFAETLSLALTGNSIPYWINRAARFGSSLAWYTPSCFVPTGMGLSQQMYEHYEGAQQKAREWGLQYGTGTKAVDTKAMEGRGRHLYESNEDKRPESRRENVMKESVGSILDGGGQVEAQRVLGVTEDEPVSSLQIRFRNGEKVSLRVNHERHTLSSLRAALAVGWPSLCGESAAPYLLMGHDRVVIREEDSTLASNNLKNSVLLQINRGNR